MRFLTMFAITFSLFVDRVPKHGIICFAEISFSFETFVQNTIVTFMEFLF